MHLLTKYEVSQIVAMRALMIYDGAHILIDLPNENVRDNTLDIAYQELLSGKLRFKIARHIGGKDVEIESSQCVMPVHSQSNFFR